MKNPKLTETFPQTFTAGLYRCVVEIFDGDVAVAKCDGAGGNPEIARANAYREMVSILVTRCDK